MKRPCQRDEHRHTEVPSLEPLRNYSRQRISLMIYSASGQIRKNTCRLAQSLQQFFPYPWTTQTSYWRIWACICLAYPLTCGVGSWQRIPKHSPIVGTARIRFLVSCPHFAQEGSLDSNPIYPSPPVAPLSISTLEWTNRVKTFNNLASKNCFHSYVVCS